ncbi:mini-chromosome maintenance complex-binding protein [Lepeophtheirus salmonis]|uniref:mini-chromosome maintenance complex-binding protein n=1 Tax=Lepeophtheirus salmonis TaxID=72036 RepID=UPI001AE32958|nr:mini-chromosome maintenance complex-binding protein-like [Lepeophtheirus salmonis]
MWSSSSDRSLFSTSLASHIVSTMPSSSSQSILDSVQSLKGLSESEIQAFWSCKIEGESRVPHITEGDVKPGKLVRFRGMIQDSLETELYPEDYRYQDSYDGQEDFEENPVLKERWIYYIVSIPGETNWVQQSSKTILDSIPSSSTQNQRFKRPLDSDEDTLNDVPMESKPITTTENKKAKLTHVATEPSSWGLNFPIPSQPGASSVIAKIYGDASPDLVLNEPIDLFGIIAMSEEEDIQSSDENIQVRVPPPSIVPRIHVLLYKKLTHINPLLPLSLKYPTCELDMGGVREEVVSVFSNLLFGDRLSAEYLICHLASRVYGRNDVHSLGKYSLNLINVPLHGDYVSRFASVLSNILSCCHYLPLTIQNLNSFTFIPRKDYNANRLISGILQLCAGTHLILDETQLDSGKLTSDGLKNLTALGNLITWQKVEYNFSYYQMEFSADVPCLILSEGRSMLPSDVLIPLKPNHSTSYSVIDEKFKNIQDNIFADEKILNKFRKFLTITQNCPYDITDEVQKSIQDDFVVERKNNPNYSAEDLSNRLLLARFVSLTYGNTTLTPEVWNRVKAMEFERQERTSALPSRQASAIGQSGIPAKL